MARIQVSIHIEANDSVEAADIMSRLQDVKFEKHDPYADKMNEYRRFERGLTDASNVFASPTDPAAYPVNAAGDTAVEAADQGAESPQQPAARRGRPKKDTTATTAASDTAASGDQSQPQEAGATADGQSSGQTATTAASPSDPATAAGAVVTKDQLVDVMSKAMETIDPAKIQAHLETKLGAGMKSASTIPAERYGDAIAAIEGLLALS